MPNTKGAKKRLRQDAVRKVANHAKKTRVRHSLRKFREAVAANELESAQQLSQQATKLLDRAASQGVIHRNKAARLKSRMAHQLVAAKSPAA